MLFCLCLGNGTLMLFCLCHGNDNLMLFCLCLGNGTLMLFCLSGKWYLDVILSVWEMVP